MYHEYVCKSLAAIFIVASTLIFYPARAACIVKDDANNLISLSQPAKRIISLAPDITETLFAIGAGKQIIGVMQGSDYPANARELPHIGSYHGIDLERIISMHPDLIVNWGRGFPRELNALKKMGIPIYIAQPRKLEDVANTMKNLGCLTGNDILAQQTAMHYSHRLSALRRQYHYQKTITVFYQIGTYSLITINKESWIHQAILLCGGRNIFANAMTVSPQVTWEAIMAANPEVVINGDTTENWKTRWQRWSEMTAVKSQRLYTIHPDLIHRAGPRLIEGVEEVCYFLNKARRDAE